MNAEKEAPLPSGSVPAQGDPVPALPPLSIGELLDRALQLLKPAVLRTWVLILLAALLNVGTFVLQAYNYESISLLPAIASFVIYIYLFFVSVYMASALWCGSDASLHRARSRIHWRRIFRFFGLSLWMSFIAMLGFLLLIIPGVVYLMNRCLAVYVLLLEQPAVFQSLRKSKLLMTRAPWYALSGPLMRVFGLSIVLWTMLAFSMILQGIFQLVAYAGGVYFAAGVGVQLVTGVIAGAIQIFSQIAYVGFYYDLRARYEGSDLLAQLSAFSGPRS